MKVDSTLICTYVGRLLFYQQDIRLENEFIREPKFIDDAIVGCSIDTLLNALQVYFDKEWMKNNNFFSVLCANEVVIRRSIV